MINSRLARLKHAKNEFDHGKKHNFKDFAQRGKVLIDLILEICDKNPLPPTRWEYQPEMFFAQVFARGLVEDSPLYLLRTGRYEDVYATFQDPASLGHGMAWALTSHPESEIYDELQQILKKSLALGGVVPASFIISMNALNDVRKAREEFNFPPVLQVKQLLHNQIKNEWAVEPNADEIHRYGTFFSLMTSYVADHDPEWALGFLRDNKKRLQEIFDNNLLRVRDPELKCIACCIDSIQSVAMFTQLEKEQPAHYKDLMENPYMIPLMLHLVETTPQFKIFEMPEHPVIIKALVIAMFIRCAGADALTQDRLDDLEATWGRVAEKGILVRDAFKNVHCKEIVEEMNAYSDFLRNPSLTPQDIFESGKLHDLVGMNYLFLDSLKNKPGSRIIDDPAVHARHMAFTMVAKNHYMNEDTISVLPKSEYPLSVALLLIEDDPEGLEAKDLGRFVQQAFESKTYRGEVARLSSHLVEIARERISGLDEGMLRKINWKDHTIKGRFLAEDLGM